MLLLAEALLLQPHARAVVVSLRRAQVECGGLLSLRRFVGGDVAGRVAMGGVGDLDVEELVPAEGGVVPAHYYGWLGGWTFIDSFSRLP